MVEKMQSEEAQAGLGENSALDTATYKPKTSLGQRLWEIRSRLAASGEPLLDWEEIEREVADRRGEAG